ncbi:MAG TPA: GNAT family N-acetyltransferase [Dermatophilaceae bacterium]|nr:GNAT family N-acetyltransferase [Dermatophilaceae bacterium]
MTDGSAESGETAPTSRPYAVRPAVAGDAAAVADARRRWAREQRSAELVDADDGFEARFDQWWEETEGRRHTWIAVPQVDGHEAVGVEAVGMVQLTVFSRMPSPGQPTGRWAYVGQVWVEPAYRRHGVATALMRAAIEWARREGMLRLVLNPSEMSRPMYAALGFRSASDLLRLDLV